MSCATQPMDGPYTFSFLFSEQTHACAAGMLVTLVLVAALRCKRDTPAPDWRWLGVIVLMLFVGRWPTIWYPHQLNPDESQLLAGACTLRFDPVFWRSVNGMTSGPLNFFALWPAGALFGDGYLAARLTALGLIATALGCVHLSVSRRYGARIARVSGLPTVCFLSLTATADFTHYSTELLSMALIAIGIYLASRMVFEGVTSSARELTFGFLLGCVPFAKLQAAPIAFALGVALTAWLMWSASAARPGRGWRVARVAGSAFIPAGCAAVLIGAYQLGPYVWVAYWLNNRAYVENAPLSVFRTAFRLLAKTDPPSPLFFIWAFSGLGFFAIAMLWLKSRSRRDWDFILASTALLLVAAISIVVPRRTFPHYLMLLPVPWAMLCGGIAGAFHQQRAQSRLAPVLSLGALSVMVLALATARVVVPEPLQRHFSPFTSDFSGHIAAEIKRYSTPGDALAVWGWRSEYHVLTGLRQAARDALSESLISPGRYREYFRKIYLADVMSSRPAVFVDGVGPGGFYFSERATQAHEAVFPELATWVRENYILAADIEGSRIYVRADRYRNVAQAQPSQQRDLPGRTN